MRLPDDFARRALALGLTVLLASCGLVRGDSGSVASAPAADQMAVATTGPEADYPVVLGDPVTVDGQVFTPSDTLNYDEVGYAALDGDATAGVTVAHKTLPLPSYVEITALESGKTILARVERRGPMTASKLVALSPGAQSQLGVGEGAALRVRRVNPPESDRALLRMGQAAPDRMETPSSLLAVLNRKLPQSGSASLASVGTPTPAAPSASAPVAAAPVRELAPVTRVAQAALPAVEQSFDAAFAGQRRVNTAYPLPPLTSAARTTAVAYREPAAAQVPWVETPRAAPPAAIRPAPARTDAPRATPPAPSRATAGDGFVIQAAAFSSKANADRAARQIGGFVEQSGRVWRVRKGPFANRGQAEAALANVRAAGYSDARVFSAG